MPVPDYQTLMLPLLKRLDQEKEPVPVRSFIDSIADEFGLAPEERAERLPSGAENLMSNRLAWARTYLGKAGLLVSPKRGVVSITDAGRDLIREKPTRIDVSVLRRYPQFNEWIRRSQRSATEAIEDDSHDIVQRTDAPQGSARQTPRERIDAAQRELDATLRADLLDRVREMTPSDFEGLIIRLLLKMGYGEGQLPTIARRRRFVCSQCASRPDWRAHRAVGMGTMNPVRSTPGKHCYGLGGYRFER